MKPPVLATAIDFFLAALACVAATLWLWSGSVALAVLYYCVALVWFVAGCFGLQSLVLLIKAAEYRGEARALGRVRAVAGEWSR